jgi:hypothetical protein
VIDLGRACGRHGPALVEFVDHGAVGPDTPAALRHLEGCRRCTEAVEATLLTITALRRIADDLDRVEPRPDAWPRLRARLTALRLRRRPAVMSPLAGVAMSFAIVAVLVLPFRLGVVPAEPSARPTPTHDAAAVTDSRIELAYLASSRRVTFDGPAADDPSIGTVAGKLPAEIWQVRKEVHAAKPTVRPVEPI